QFAAGVAEAGAQRPILHLGQQIPRVGVADERAVGVGHRCQVVPAVAEAPDAIGRRRDRAQLAAGVGETVDGPVGGGQGGDVVLLAVALGVGVAVAVGDAVGLDVGRLHAGGVEQVLVAVGLGVGERAVEVLDQGAVAVGGAGVGAAGAGEEQRRPDLVDQQHAGRAVAVGGDRHQLYLRAVAPAGARRR